MTPTTDDVRYAYATRMAPVRDGERYAEFDAWLAAHDAEVREQAAQRIEKMLPFYTTRPTRLALRAASEAVRWV